MTNLAINLIVFSAGIVSHALFLRVKVRYGK